METLNLKHPRFTTRNQPKSLIDFDRLYSESQRSIHPLRLDRNEMPFDIPRDLKEQLMAKLIDIPLNRYPDFYNSELTQLIAKSIGVEAENIVLGNGSSQLIQQLVGCLAKVFSKAIIEKPTFSFYHHVLANERMPYQEWELTEDGVFELAQFPPVNEPTLVMLSSPNNPTGALLPHETLRQLLETYPNSVFIIDEAYAEFGGPSAVALINEYANLMVLKTFSKAYGLPGLRLGYVVGGASLIQLVKKHTVPFTINIYTEAAVKELLTNPAFEQAVRISRERVKNLREFVCYLLDDLSTPNSFAVYPTGTNFLLMRFDDASLYEAVRDMFAKRKILVSYPMDKTIRLTIGTEPEMLEVVRLMKHAVNQQKAFYNE
jgi:histidinol-phosphate aminotransferase